jgi:2-oxoglutarate dehydrogenase E2 component (dihydrolipoamide succinyltransferase)
MPQLGESIAEGTVTRWLKQVGDQVERDEPLLEISTDKVDAEIPSPAAGVLSEVRVKEGETVEVGTVVALIGTADDSTTEGTTATDDAESTRGQGAVVASSQQPPSPSRKTGGGSEGRQTSRSSPAVRKLAREHDIDIALITGSGTGGRVTKDDVLAYLETRQAPEAATGGTIAEHAGLTARTEPVSIMRQKIAEHMVRSRRTSAHVHTVFDTDFTHVARIREAKKAEYEKAGAKLTFLPFIIRAVTRAIQATPVVNASLDGDQVVYKDAINIGIAVALDGGLIVPVLKNADGMSMLDLSRGISDLAARSRTKRLKPDEVDGGTFTITNPGTFGSALSLPIINQPQVAILSVGSIEKRPVVINDAIAIRSRSYLTLGFDHRLIDGAVADEFMARVKQAIEEFDDSQV